MAVCVPTFQTAKQLRRSLDKEVSVGCKRLSLLLFCTRLWFLPSAISVHRALAGVLWSLREKHIFVQLLGLFWFFCSFLGLISFLFLAKECRSNHLLLLRGSQIISLKPLFQTPIVWVMSFQDYYFQVTINNNNNKRLFSDSSLCWLVENERGNKAPYDWLTVNDNPSWWQGQSPVVSSWGWESETLCSGIF